MNCRGKGLKKSTNWILVTCAHVWTPWTSAPPMTQPILLMHLYVTLPTVCYVLQHMGFLIQHSTDSLVENPEEKNHAMFSTKYKKSQSDKLRGIPRISKSSRQIWTWNINSRCELETHGLNTQFSQRVHIFFLVMYRRTLHCTCGHQRRHSTYPRIHFFIVTWWPGRQFFMCGISQPLSHSCWSIIW